MRKNIGKVHIFRENIILSFYRNKLVTNRNKPVYNTPMKNLLMHLGALLVLGGTFIPSAMAQTRPAITQDRDQAGRNFYTANLSCTTVTFGYCGVTFPAVPAGKRLIITQVSMLNLSPVVNSITSIDLRYHNGSIIAFLNSQLNAGTTGGTFNYTVNETVFAKFDAGDAPQLLTFLIPGVNSFQMVGIISGYMIDVP